MMDDDHIIAEWTLPQSDHHFAQVNDEEEWTIEGWIRVPNDTPFRHVPMILDEERSGIRVAIDGIWWPYEWPKFLRKWVYRWRKWRRGPMQV